MSPIQVADEETVATVTELARQLHQSPKDVIAQAIREKIDRERERAERIERMMQIAKKTAKLFPPGVTSTNITDWPYDENGLPK